MQAQTSATRVNRTENNLYAKIFEKEDKRQKKRDEQQRNRIK